MTTRSLEARSVIVTGGGTGITDHDFFVTDDLDATTMVLFATASRPRRAVSSMGRQPSK